MKKNFYIGNHNLGVSPCYIIAEIGSNHDGNKERAFQLIRLCSEAGANAVKFQLFSADKIAANIDLPETRLKDQFSKFGKTIYDLYKGMELPVSWLNELKECCIEHNVDFIITPFDEESADIVAKTGVKAIKIASFEITHIPLLKHVAKLGMPILVSTGMADMEEVAVAIKTLENAGENRIVLFHCGIQYPAPYDSVNLNCLNSLRDRFQCPVGYSDHTKGIIVPIAAVALGASLYEKHVTLNEGESPDHDFALSINEFTEMVSAIRNCERALGRDIKEVQEGEKIHKKRGRRSCFVVQDIKVGELFTKDNLAVLRPGCGIQPNRYEEIIGKKANKDIKAPAMLKEGDWV